jgi:N-acetylglutamate synthase-like GNAT family acetyltransferase
VITRRPTEKDVDKILALGKKYEFDLPTQFHSAAVVEKEGDILAFGVVRPIAEVFMVCRGSPRKVIQSTGELLKIGIHDARSMGYKQVYAFIEKDETFGRVLTELYGFREFPGKFYVLDL